MAEKESIEITFDYKSSELHMNFSDNLTDGKECGYILSAAFFSFCAEQGLSKETVIDLVSTQYDNFLQMDK